MSSQVMHPTTIPIRQPSWDSEASTRISENHSSTNSVGRSNLDYFGGDASDTYNSLQVVAEKRFTRGYEFLAHYTWSKALGYDTDYYAIDPKLNYGVANTDRKHVFVLTNLIELPFGKGKKFSWRRRSRSKPHRQGLVAERNHDLGERLAFFSVIFKLWRRPRHRSLPAESCRTRSASLGMGSLLHNHGWLTISAQRQK